MDTLLQLLDFVLHVDRYLEAFVENYGTWVYALLFLIIFVETGLVVMPFLPGDSLLFVVGTLCGTGLLDLELVMALLLLAAIAGDQVNYRIGRYFGPKVFQWESSRFFNRAAFDKAHNFYETYGGITIVLARFMPFIRTFVPFVAGVAAMTPSRFVGCLHLGLWPDNGGVPVWRNGLCQNLPEPNHLGHDHRARFVRLVGDLACAQNLSCSPILNSL